MYLESTNLSTLLSDVDVRRLVDTGSVDEDAYTSMLLWFLATGGDGHRLIFGGCDEVGAYPATMLA